MGSIVDEAQAHRAELLTHCYRLLGSYSEAEDAVQETFIKAWRGSFEGRSSVRTWLYRVATTTCLDMLKAPQRRALPTDLAEPGDVPADPRTLTVQPEATWLGPYADHHDPAAVAEHRDTVRLAFVSALQRLPPNQRAVLVLRDVLSFSADETAQILQTSVASVTSALSRARAGAAVSPDPGRSSRHVEQGVLQSYIEAFERYDVDALVSLLQADAEFSMPPYELWLRGSDTIRAWWSGPGRVCEGSRLLPSGANGQPAVAVYHPHGPDRWEPFALHVLDVGDGRIRAITHFMGPAVFAEFGLPAALTGP